MICFAPVVGILFFHRFKMHLIGAAISTLTILVVFSPFIVVDYHKEAFLNAYVNTLGQYPVITMNAANLWILLIGNNAPDNIQFLMQVSHFLPQKLIYPKYLGMFLYASIALCIFIIGIDRLLKNKKTKNEDDFLASVIFYTMVSAIAFFTLLPAMHERYLFPAVVCAIIYSSVTKKYIAYAIGLTAASALNMLIILNINGSDIWIGLSTIITCIFTISLLQLFAGSAIYNIIPALTNSFLRIPFSPLIVFTLSVSATLAYLIDRHSVHKAELTANQSLLTDHKRIFAQQDYGVIQHNKSVDKKTLSIGNRRFENGIGTHANSTIIFELPKNAIRFDVVLGIDDEVNNADVIFEVWEDDTLLLRSAPFFGFEKPINMHVDLHKGAQLTLKVNSLGESSWDHANWVNPIITVE